MSATETYEMLKHVYGSDTLPRKLTFELHRRFRQSKESAEDYGCSGSQKTSRTAENGEKVSAVVHELKSELQGELQEMAENGFQKCLDDLYKRWQMSVAAQRSYFKGGCVSAI
ncbi:hypothetical protein TNCV_4879771 [Trichonephila clavipes]|nr:hypothetical protein TNCV_4879771 [Trichonephila clavipes]